jgi:uncharacterized protein (TIGR02996 family)
MDHAAFLEAIAARPDDDTPRLVYADWLEERGDPRGAFVRVQCALERLSADDPRRPALEDQADDLLAAHEEEWAAQLRGAARDWRFRRGFVEWVDADAETFLVSNGAWFAAFPLRGVRLRLQSPKLVPAVAACPHLERLKSLALRGGFLRDRELRELLASPYLGRLADLGLVGHGIETLGVRALTEFQLLPRLRSLDLSDNHAVGDQAVRALAGASGAAGLHTLNLARTNLTPRGVSDLFGSPFLQGLRELDVSTAKRRDLAGLVESIAQSPVFANLAALDLGGHPLQPADLQRLFAAAGGRTFVRLGLAGCGLDAAAAEALAAIPFGGLTALDLRRNRLGPDGLRALAEAPGLASLTALRLGWNDVRDTGAKALAASPHLTRLTALDLSHNNIGGPGLRALAASPNLAGLRELDLSANYVGPSSVEALTSSPHLSRLRTLTLPGDRPPGEPEAPRSVGFLGFGRRA